MRLDTRIARARFTGREEARRILTAKVDAPAPIFATFDPEIIRADAAFRLRYIDCAPEGANHQIAPGQDKMGVPMGGCRLEAVGPDSDFRAARVRLGLNPFG